jgi:hypothetical protein
MIGLLGAKIWIENQVDFANPINLVPIGAGIILAIGPVSHQVSGDFTLEGIALGTIVLLVGYHLLRWLSPAHMRADLDRPAGPRPSLGERHRATLGEVGFEVDSAATHPTTARPPSSGANPPAEPSSGADPRP